MEPELGSKLARKSVEVAVLCPWRVLQPEGVRRDGVLSTGTHGGLHSGGMGVAERYLIRSPSLHFPPVYFPNCILWSVRSRLCMGANTGNLSYRRDWSWEKSE